VRWETFAVESPGRVFGLSMKLFWPQKFWSNAVRTLSLGIP
jgi:hypothetical protein